MTEPTDSTTTQKMNANATDVAKYRQAGCGFLGLNVLYLVLVFVFLPTFTPDASTLASIILYLAVLTALSFYVWKGKRTLTLVLAVIYALRSAVSAYTLVTGQAFPVVPYVLPLLLISFYLLGRAVWDWR